MKSKGSKVFKNKNKNKKTKKTNKNKKTNKYSKKVNKNVMKGGEIALPSEFFNMNKKLNKENLFKWCTANPGMNSYARNFCNDKLKGYSGYSQL